MKKPKRMKAETGRCIAVIQKLFDGEKELATLAHKAMHYDDERRHNANACCFYEAMCAIRQASGR